MLHHVEKAAFWPQSLKWNFPAQIDEALRDLDSVFNIVDDVVISGCGSSDAEPQSDNQ